MDKRIVEKTAQDSGRIKASEGLPRRLVIDLHGAIQGVGFRPFVYRLAKRFDLTGLVANHPGGVRIETEGLPHVLETFLCALQAEAPPPAVIHSFKHVWLEPVGYSDFRILPSEAHGEPTAWILPDIATCPECIKEIFDPKNRRYFYPFTNCTHCGPRYTLLDRLPYDRANTAMKDFVMCPECEREYHDPDDRRFHAQPNACPHCGPMIAYWDRDGNIHEQGDGAISRAACELREGCILAVKGLGGFHLMVDASDSLAVRRLREKKHRAAKPFAVMVPDLGWAERLVHLSSRERRWLASPEAPILLVDQKGEAALWIAPEVAPNNPLLGIFLPYTPLHHILMHRIGRPVVATSGNLSEEPLCIDEKEALQRLGPLVDGFLVHNRPIRRPVDDSVGRMIAGREVLLRRSRGYVPLPLPFLWRGKPAIAMGGHLKNTVAIALNDRLLLGPHGGDLETLGARDRFTTTIQDLKDLTGSQPTLILHDLHPDYASTVQAQRMAGEKRAVQHHLAHVLSGMADNAIDPPVLGVAWDGTGHGMDGTIWGGEFLTIDEGRWERVATFRSFPLLGGEAAMREPRRSALGLLGSLFGDSFNESVCPSVWGAFTPKERAVLLRLLTQTSLSPKTTSVGRLFDAVASIMGLLHRNLYEGQAAMALEWAAMERGEVSPYPFIIRETGKNLVIDWEPMIRAVLEEMKAGASPGSVSARFHETLAEMIAAVAKRIGIQRVVLSGGCFQNRFLTELSVKRLLEAGFIPYPHQRIPPNDGGLAAGQLAALRYSLV